VSYSRDGKNLLRKMLRSKMQSRMDMPDASSSLQAASIFLITAREMEPV
jgi:hypothetical protein